MWSGYRESCQWKSEDEIFRRWKQLIRKHLKTNSEWPLIRPGDSVIIKRVVWNSCFHTSRVEPRVLYSSLQRGMHHFYNTGIPLGMLFYITEKFFELPYDIKNTNM